MRETEHLCLFSSVTMMKYFENAKQTTTHAELRLQFRNRMFAESGRQG